jgi:hypothetical protein
LECKRIKIKMMIGKEIILMKERKIIKIFLANLIFVEFLDL